MNAKRLVGWALIAAFVVVVAVMLAPGFATLVGRAIANLWVTVMGAVAGILGGFIGQ
ncbi:MAG: hypothetical protein ABMA00_12755 [Gemmatimonas sp.]